MTTLRLSYAELAKRIGRSAEGARMLARRRHWPVTRGNDGKATVLVEEAELVVRPTGRPDEQPPGQPDEATGRDQGQIELHQRLQELEAAAEKHQVELLRVTARAAHAEGEAQALREALADLSVRLDATTTELRELRRPWLLRVIEALRR
jgi:hypothetical protein